MRHGIHVAKRNRNLIISHCQIYYNTGVSVYLEDLNLHQAIINNNQISYCRLGGIRIERSEVRNLQITGNDIEYNNHRVHKTEPEPTAEILHRLHRRPRVRPRRHHRQQHHSSDAQRRRCEHSTHR